MEDSDLLRQYAERRSEDAFAELVRRHLNLVYSAALRQVDGDSYLAQDATQCVFADLARKAASLSRHPSITGWLYTSVHYTITKSLRGERRRRMREQEIHTMSESFTTDSSPCEWEQLRPVIDEAMCKLPEDDREAILLRYFESKPFGAIGTKLGLTENAARMRVERALDKLRGLVAARGVASTSVAIAAVLTAQSVSAAPPGLAATVTGASLATAGAMTAAQTGFSSLVSMLKLKLILPLAIGVAGVATLLWQHRTLAALRDENVTLRTQTQELAERSGDAATQSQAKINADELKRLRQQNLELLRLRSELGRLRQELATRASARTNDATEVASEPPKEDAPPQIHIKAEFITLPTSKLAELGLPQAGQSPAFPDSKFRLLQRQLLQIPEAKRVSSPEVTTLSGRQAQMQALQVESDAEGKAVSWQRYGPTLDVLPTLGVDGVSINLSVFGDIVHRSYTDRIVGRLALAQPLNARSSTNASPPEPVANYSPTSSTGMSLPSIVGTNVIKNIIVRDGQSVAMVKPLDPKVSEGDSAQQGAQSLLVLITTVLLDPVGNRVHSDEELEEATAKNGK